MRRFALLLAPLVVLATTACEDTPTENSLEFSPDFAMAGGITASVAGSGHIPSGDDDRRVFSFTARQHANGSVSGQFALLITNSVLGSENPSVTRIEAEVTCMSAWGNTAWVGGVVKNSSNPDWIGKETGWAVQDNGEGPDGYDLISLMDIPNEPGTAQAVCDSQSRWPNILVEGGNVQVRTDDYAGGGQQFFPFWAWIATCGEPVEVTGYFHPVFQFTADQAGGFHAQGHVNAHGTGLGLSTGSIYNWNEVFNYAETFRPPQATYTYQQSFLLTGRGDAPNQTVHANFHVTVTPNGVFNVTADNFRADCG